MKFIFYGLLLMSVIACGKIDEKKEHKHDDACKCEQCDCTDCDCGHDGTCPADGCNCSCDHN